jgi:hypothetical protein
MNHSELSRRGFLTGCTACAAAAACPLLARPASSGQAAPPDGGKPVLRLVFTHLPKEEETWPYQGYDYEKRKEELTVRLRQACPAAEFRPATAMSAEEARKILEADREVDGYVVYMVGIWSGAPRTIAASGRPTLFVDDLYAGSGEWLIALSEAKRKGFNVAGVASTRFDDVVQAIKAFEVMKKLRSSVILDVTDRDPSSNGRAIQEMFGTRVIQITGAEINEAYAKADGAEAQTAARRCMKEAKRIVEPTTEEIEKSGRMYMAMKELMQARQSRALTIDCLNLFYGGKLPAYPCLGLFQFNNDGDVGACEADLQSTITMLLMSHMTGRPGYISDPVIDTAKNQIIYAHCVAPSKVYGPNGPSNPYHIRSHSEDRKGASVRSLMPVGEITTTLKYHPLLREVVIHQAKTVANIDEDKACRTKLAAEVRDASKLVSEWDRHGWHRVTYYGDYRKAVETISALLGFRVLEEG